MPEADRDVGWADQIASPSDPAASAFYSWKMDPVVAPFTDKTTYGLVDVSVPLLPQPKPDTLTSVLASPFAVPLIVPPVSVSWVVPLIVSALHSTPSGQFFSKITVPNGKAFHCRRRSLRRQRSRGWW